MECCDPIGGLVFQMYAETSHQGNLTALSYDNLLPSQHQLKSHHGNASEWATDGQ
jgi:hypothetical protein